MQNLRTPGIAALGCPPSSPEPQQASTTPVAAFAHHSISWKGASVKFKALLACSVAVLVARQSYAATITGNFTHDSLTSTVIMPEGSRTTDTTASLADGPFTESTSAAYAILDG